LEKTPGFSKKKKPAQWVFLGFLVFFGFSGFFVFFFIYLPKERGVFRVFSVSRILLGASRL
jgi:hypothetical protein